MSTFKIDKAKASFITDEIKQHIIDLSHNNKMFLPYLNAPNKEKFWELIKNESIFIKMAIALIFDEKTDMFGGCKVFPFEFLRCEAVLELNLPDSIEAIKGLNGLSLPNLAAINVSNCNEHFMSIDGALFHKKSKRLICYPVKKANKRFEVPSSAKAIEKYCFAKNNFIEEIHIADGLTKIGMHCFSSCKALKSINIPTSVKEISRSAFRDDDQLISITIPDTVKEIKDNLFDSCINLKSVTIGKNVECICFDAFRNCSSLVSLYLPDSVRTIQGYAFHMCKSLKNVSLPKNIKSIDGSVFTKCNSLSSIEYRGTIEQWNSIAMRFNQINYKNNIKTIHCIDGDIKI